MLVVLVQIGLLLACAVVLGRLAMRLGMPVIVGELLTGVLVGAFVLGQHS
jgi:Kef-type K+ transport system membrane component KefB